MEKGSKSKCSKDYFDYNEETDRSMCPSGQNLEFIKEHVSKDKKFTLYGCTKEIDAKRSPEIEGVFGQIKNNRGLRRFVLRGLGKDKAELDEPKA